MGKFTLTLDVTERDKKLLKIMAVALVILLFYYAAVRPLTASISNLSAQLDEAQKRQEEMEQKIANLPIDESQLTDLKQALLKETEEFYDAMNNSQIDKMMTQIALDHSLSVSNLSIQVEPNYQIPNAYLASTDEQTDDSSAAETEIGLMCSRITMEVSGSKANFRKMLDTIIHQETSMNIVSYSTDSEILFSVSQTYVEKATMQVVVDLYTYDKSDLSN
jgi:hypothetical protein